MLSFSSPSTPSTRLSLLEVAPAPLSEAPSPIPFPPPPPPPSSFSTPIALLGRRRRRSGEEGSPSTLFSFARWRRWRHPTLGKCHPSRLFSLPPSPLPAWLRPWHLRLCSPPETRQGTQSTLLTQLQYFVLWGKIVWKSRISSFNVRGIEELNIGAGLDFIMQLLRPPSLPPPPLSCRISPPTIPRAASQGSLPPPAASSASSDMAWSGDCGMESLHYVS